MVHRSVYINNVRHRKSFLFVWVHEISDFSFANDIFKNKIENQNKFDQGVQGEGDNDSVLGAQCCFRV